MDKESNIANKQANKDEILKKYKSALNVKSPEPFKQEERYSVKDFERWMDKVTEPQEGYFNRTTELPRGFLKQEEFKKRELVDVNNDVLLDDVTRKVREDIVNENFLKNSLNSEERDLEQDEILSVDEINNYIDESVNIDSESLVVDYRMELNKRSDVVNNFKRVNSKYENFDDDNIKLKINEINDYNSSRDKSEIVPFDYMTKYKPSKDIFVENILKKDEEESQIKTNNENEGKLHEDEVVDHKLVNDNLKTNSSNNFIFLDKTKAKGKARSYKNFVYSDKSGAKHLHLLEFDDSKNLNLKKTEKYHHSIFTKVADKVDDKKNISNSSDSINLSNDNQDYLEKKIVKNDFEKRLINSRNAKEEELKDDDFLNLFKENEDELKNEKNKIDSEKLVSNDLQDNVSNYKTKEKTSLKRINNINSSNISAADNTLEYIFDDNKENKNKKAKSSSKSLNIYNFQTSSNNSLNVNNENDDILESSSFIFENNNDTKNGVNKISDEFVSSKLIESNINNKLNKKNKKIFEENDLISEVILDKTDNGNLSKSSKSIKVEDIILSSNADSFEKKDKVNALDIDSFLDSISEINYINNKANNNSNEEIYTNKFQDDNDYRNNSKIETISKDELDIESIFKTFKLMKNKDINNDVGKRAIDDNSIIEAFKLLNMKSEDSVSFDVNALFDNNNSSSKYDKKSNIDLENQLFNKKDKLSKHVTSEISDDKTKNIDIDKIFDDPEKNFNYKVENDLDSYEFDDIKKTTDSLLKKVDRHLDILNFDNIIKSPKRNIKLNNDSYKGKEYEDNGFLKERTFKKANDSESSFININEIIDTRTNDSSKKNFENKDKLNINQHANQNLNEENLFEKKHYKIDIDQILDLKFDNKQFNKERNMKFELNNLSKSSKPSFLSKYRIDINDSEILDGSKNILFKEDKDFNKNKWAYENLEFDKYNNRSLDKFVEREEGMIDRFLDEELKQNYKNDYLNKDLTSNIINSIDLSAVKTNSKEHINIDRILNLEKDKFRERNSKLQDDSVENIFEDINKPFLKKIRQPSKNSITDYDVESWLD